MRSNDPFQVLMTAAPELTGDAAAGILKEHYGIEGRLKSLVSERDQNFLVTASTGVEYVFKIANSAEHWDVTDFQTKALQHLEHSGSDLPVPRVVRTQNGESQILIAGENGRTHCARVLSWLPGVPLKAIEGGLRDPSQLGALLARLGIALSEFRHPMSNYALLWDIKRADKIRMLLDDVADRNLRDRCREHLDRFVHTIEPRLRTLRTQVIYNDLNPSNVLADPERPGTVTGIIDFGDMVESPLVVDVAVACAYLCNDSAKPLSDVMNFVKGYNRVNKLESEEIELLFELMLLRHVVTVLITNWRASQYPDNKEYILRNEPRARRTIELLAEMNAEDVAKQIRVACNES